MATAIKIDVTVNKGRTVAISQGVRGLQGKDTVESAVNADRAEAAQVASEIAKVDAEAARDVSDANALSTITYSEQTALDRIATAADRVVTNSDVVITNDNRIAAQASADSVEADAIQTGLDAIATAEDRIQTGLDSASIASDVAQVSIDAAQVASDLIATGADVISTAADRVQTGSDVIATAADRGAVNAAVQISILNEAATSEDASEAAASASAAAASAASTAADVANILDSSATASQAVEDAVQVAADRVQTGLDATATAADRVQTGLDAIATAADKFSANQSRMLCDTAVNLTSEDQTQTAQYRTDCLSFKNDCFDYAASANTDANLANSAKFATSADRVQTELDVTTTNSNVTTTNNAAAAAAQSAIDAATYAATFTNGLIMMGQWDASGGIAPPTPAGDPDEPAHIYRVITEGTINSILYPEDSEIIWDVSANEWFKGGGGSGGDGGDADTLQGNSLLATGTILGDTVVGRNSNGDSEFNSVYLTNLFGKGLANQTIGSGEHTFLLQQGEGSTFSSGVYAPHTLTALVNAIDERGHNWVSVWTGSDSIVSNSFGIGKYMIAMGHVNNVMYLEVMEGDFASYSTRYQWGTDSYYVYGNGLGIKDFVGAKVSMVDGTQSGSNIIEIWKARNPI